MFAEDEIVVRVRFGLRIAAITYIFTVLRNVSYCQTERL